MDAEHGTGLGPRPSAHGRLHTQVIAARRQTGVAHYALVARYFIPLTIQPFHLISVAGELGIKEVERGKLQREVSLFVGERQFLCVNDRLRQRRSDPDRSSLSTYLQLRETNRRIRGRIHHLVRIEGNQSAEAPKEHLAV